jgi:hypothetical protein
MNTKADFLAEIEKKTAINFAKYQVPELVENIKNIFTTIPRIYFIILQPILVLAILPLLFVLLQKQHNVASILFGFILLSVALMVGGGIGFYRVATKLLTETKGAMNISLDTTVYIYKDLQIAQKQATEQNFAIPPTAEVLKGVVLGILLPTLKDFAIQQAGILAKGVLWVLEKAIAQVLLLLTKFIELGIEKLPLEKTDKEIDKWNEKIEQQVANKLPVMENKLKRIENIITLLENSKTQLNTYLGIANKLVTVPIVSVVAVYGAVSVFLLFILWFFIP